MRFSSKGKCRGVRFLALAALAAAPAAAFGQTCQDVEYVNEIGEKMKPADCEEVETGALSLEPILSCPARSTPKNRDFHGLGLMKATKHKLLDGTLRTLDRGYYISIDFGTEDQLWVLEKVQVTSANGKYEVQGQLVEAVLSEEGKATEVDRGAPKAVVMKFKLRRDGETKEPAWVELNDKRRMRCGNGSFSGESMSK